MMPDIPQLAQQIYDLFPHTQEWCEVYQRSSGMYEAVIDASTEATKTGADMKVYLEQTYGVTLQGMGMQTKRGKYYYVIGFRLKG